LLLEGATSGSGKLWIERLRSVAKGVLVAMLPAATCWIESRLSGRDEAFLFWGQVFALVPGLQGKYLRKCYYRLTLKRCSLSCELGFLTFFNDRRAEVGERVYVGSGVGMGLVCLGDGVLIGSRASLINGGGQHAYGPDGRLTPFQSSLAQPIRIGPETWIGEAAVVMADVGGHCIIGAAGVVSRPVPDGCIVAGNPARFIRRTFDNVLADETSVRGSSS
jgi:acetyltransferase-like isoleucine patch superfamily enzyme